jgi:hypothetical protein
MRTIFASLILGLVLLAPEPSAAGQSTGLRVEGTRFAIADGDGQTLVGAQLTGAELDLGDTGVVRVVAVEPDPSARFDEVWLHTLELRQPGTTQFRPFCSPDPTGDTRVVVYPGYFDDNRRYVGDQERFSMSCVSGVEAKCLRWGYLPWRKAPTTGESLEPYYNACINLARADYCADDRPSTRNGTAIDIYDRVGVQQSETSATDLTFEAGWNQNGAVCVRHTRIVQNLTLQQLATQCPRLDASRQAEHCDEVAAAASGALLFNRSRAMASP